MGKAGRGSQGFSTAQAVAGEGVCAEVCSLHCVSLCVGGLACGVFY